MASNSKPIEERLEIGKQKEADTLELLNELVKSVPDGRRVLCWCPSDRADDINHKIDAWAEFEQDDRMSVQIKFRETGQDLGIALIRPWNWEEFKQDYEILADCHYDRDYKEIADLYVVLNEQFNQLVIGDGRKIKRICEILLDSLYAQEDDPFKQRTYFQDENRYGAELRLVTDQGEGYTEGQKKIICYIKPFLVQKQGGEIHYYDPYF